MIKLRKDYPRIPPGGWSFTDPSGVTLRGTSADNLIKNIAAFRLQNSLGEGWPEREVTWFMAEKYPDFVERTESEPPEVEKTRTDYLYEWTNKLWKSPPQKLIPIKLAAKRIETCLDCPNCAEWSATSSGPQLDLRKEIIRKLIVLSQGYYRPDIGYCSAHKAHAGLLVLLPEPKVKTVPACCWIGKADSLTEE